MKATGNRTSIFALILLVLGQSALAVTIPNTFTAGTPAKAAEVNQNFSAIKSAIDANTSDIAALATEQTSLDSRVTTLEGVQAAPSLKVRAKSNNALLGYVINATSTIEVSAVTPQGYVVMLHDTGIYSYPFSLKFSGANCTGTAYAEFQMSGNGPMNNGFMGNSLGYVFEGSWSIGKNAAINVANPALSGVSYMNGYSCVNSSWTGIGSYYAAVANDPAVTGVPSGILASNYKLTFD